MPEAREIFSNDVDKNLQDLNTWAPGLVYA